MDFKQQRRKTLNEQRYHIENLRVARNFSKTLIKEMDELIRSIVLFGSNAEGKVTKKSDVDLMIVLDNVSVFVTPELREAYRVIVNNLTQNADAKLHILTMNLSDLWDMSRKGDPVLVNILRYGHPLFDRNLVEPMQYLLEIGKIRPSRESVYNYTARAETLLTETTKHLEEALLDLYYATIDIVHATLMVQGEMPPSPKEMPKIFKKVFRKNTSLLKHAVVIEELYKLAKDIEHKKIQPTGTLYDKMKKKADSLVSTLTTFNKKEIEKKDTFEL